MPWKGVELYITDVISSELDGVVRFYVINAKHIAAKKLNISTTYPSWVNNITLIFMSNKSGYQNPLTCSISMNKAQPVFLSHKGKDYSDPAWTFRHSPYTIIDTPGNDIVLHICRWPQYSVPSRYTRWKTLPNFPLPFCQYQQSAQSHPWQVQSCFHSQ